MSPPRLMSLDPTPTPAALRRMARERGVLPSSGSLEPRSPREALEMPTPLTFIFPLPPNQNREQGHWRARHRRKMAYFKLCDQWAQMPGFVPDPPRVPFERVTVTARMRMWAPMDPDNAKYRASKWPLDYLKSRGYIVNDTAKVVTWAGDPEQIIERNTATTNRLIVTLTPLAAGEVGGMRGK